jgi:hypothetical protein
VSAEYAVQPSVAEHAVQAAQPSVQAAQPRAQEPQSEQPLRSDAYLPLQATSAAISRMLTVSKAKNPLFMLVPSFAVSVPRRDADAIDLLVFTGTG